MFDHIRDVILPITMSFLEDITLPTIEHKEKHYSIKLYDMHAHVSNILPHNVDFVRDVDNNVLKVEVKETLLSFHTKLTAKLLFFHIHSQCDINVRIPALTLSVRPKLMKGDISNKLDFDIIDLIV